MASGLDLLRHAMSERGLAAYLLPHRDEHNSEYLEECDGRIQFLSGFTGSNAIVLVTQEAAYLWTDGRYYLQAAKELSQQWQMMKLEAKAKNWGDIIEAQLPLGATLGVDSGLLSVLGGETKLLPLKVKGYNIQFDQDNLVNAVWKERPKVNLHPLFSHEEWSGQPRTAKVQRIRTQIKELSAEGAFFNDLEDIGWITNLRSSGIPCSTCFKSYLIILPEGGALYLPFGHPGLTDPAVSAQLAACHLTVEPCPPKPIPKMLIVKSSLNYRYFLEMKDPIEWKGIGMDRCVRMDKEAQGFRNCHVRDGVAQAKFWAWKSKQDAVGEFEAAQYIDAMRMKQEHFKGVSFVSISSAGANAAMIHYHPTATQSSISRREEIYLLDSGGHYLDGTTDVTRTFHFGHPTQEERDAYTRVLLGNLDVERMRWPAGSMEAGQLDVLARRHLWRVGLDYKHGTGHGVGHFQCVHEGPIGIYASCKVVIEPNMIVTNEPGYYKEGHFGIRIENVLLSCGSKDGQLYFDNLTLCPYDRNLIDMTQLSSFDRAFIDAYHHRCYETLAPLLGDDHSTIAWLKQATAPL